LFHCGDDCTATPVYTDEKVFCCNGCKSVYELLYANNLCTYYNLDASGKPGLTVKEEEVNVSSFAYLDEAPIRNALLNFQDDTLHKVLFRIPGMHCSSCVWLSTCSKPLLIWAVRSGQYEDDYTPSARILFEEEKPGGQAGE
jgi:Cu+-exporting ATPase